MTESVREEQKPLSLTLTLTLSLPNMMLSCSCAHYLSTKQELAYNLKPTSL